MGVGRQMMPDKAKPDRIDAMQCSETSVGIPPGFGLCSEVADFIRIDSAAGLSQGFPSWSLEYIRHNVTRIARKEASGPSRCFGNMSAALVTDALSGGLPFTGRLLSGM